MKNFSCQACHSPVLFHDTHCPQCQKSLGYVPELQDIVAFHALDPTHWHGLNGQLKQSYKPCYNYTHYQVCNWMLPSQSKHKYCLSCQLTHTIPNLDNPEHIGYWRSLEQAKRRFLYLTQRLNIFPKAKKSDQDLLGLRFNFLMPINNHMVMTGHANGVITLNASEADVVYRETTRVKMGENYRTLLGHFRHESGHYYLELIQHLHPEAINEFRQYFGDERQDYGLALKRHYEQGPPQNWQKMFISTYASTHPWEDWAETWSHYLHMMDTLETAYYNNLQIQSNLDTRPLQFIESPIAALDFEKTLKQWSTLTHTLNALNQSMGLADAYPFTLSNTVSDKLRFIHRQVLDKAFNLSEVGANL